MKLVVPTNWRNDLLEKLDKGKIDVIYGKLDRDFVGGGRPSCNFLEVSRRRAKEHVDEIHKNGLRFYYLLNASCLGNREFTRGGQKEIYKLLDWLSDIKVDGVVITMPYLLQLIKKQYPHFEISVSCFAQINSVEKAKYWEDLGASVITLSHIELIRDFRLLKKIRENVGAKLQLIVNDNCIQDCPLFSYHNNLVSHGSQAASRPSLFIIDYCRFACRYRMIAKPENFIKATWIRPEDVRIYEDAGIDRFKLVGRTMTSESIALIAKAYSEGSYEGNLCDLFTNPSKTLWLKKPNYLHRLKYFFHPFTINIIKLIKRQKLLKDIEVVIDNKQLDGFISHFLKEDCRDKSCAKCGYCRRIADSIIKIDPEYQKKMIQDYGYFINEVISGGIFK